MHLEFYTGYTFSAGGEESDKEMDSFDIPMKDATLTYSDPVILQPLRMATELTTLKPQLSFLLGTMTGVRESNRM